MAAQVDIFPLDVQCFRITKTNDKMTTYGLKVQWPKNGASIITRKHSDLYDLRLKIKELENDDKYNLPNLPGQKWFHQVLGSQDKKKKQVNEFFKAVSHLPDKVKNNENVLQFFLANDDDDDDDGQADSKDSGPLKSPVDGNRKSGFDKMALQAAKLASNRNRKISEPLRPAGYIPSMVKEDEEDHIIEQFVMNADYTTDDGVQIKRGQIVEISEKAESGWWFVSIELDDRDEEGWVPAGYLEPIEEIAPLPPKTLFEPKDDFSEEAVYQVVSDYKPLKADELECTKGDKVKVLEKKHDGWWKVTIRNKVGFVPVVHLSQKSQPKVGAKTETKSVYKKGPPPRRNISERERRELYAEVVPKYLRNKKKAPVLNYTEVDFSEDVKPVVKPPPIPSSVLYSSINPVGLPPKAPKPSVSDDEDEGEFEHIYKNVEVDYRQQNYENVDIIQEQVEKESSMAGNKFFEVENCSYEKLAHSPALKVAKGSVIQCLKEQGQLVYGLVCSFATACKTPPALREGWISLKDLKPVDVEVVQSAGPSGVPIIRPKPQPRQTAPTPAIITPPKKPAHKTNFNPSAAGAIKPKIFANNPVNATKSEQSEKSLANGKSASEEMVWLAGILSREKCEEVMADASDREFLIRQSPKMDQYTLSVKWRKDIKHFKITCSKTGNYVIGKAEFPSLSDIVKHYKISELFVTDDKQKIRLGNAFHLPPHVLGSSC